MSLDASIPFCTTDDAWWKLFIQPFIAGFVGWLTNVIALKMLFYPVEFMGLNLVRWEQQPFGLFGWQGIIPAKTEKMARKAVDLMLEKLLNVKEIFSRLDAEEFSNVMDRGLILLIDRIISETAMEYMPRVWKGLPDDVKDEIVVKASIESNQKFLKLFMQDMQEHIDDVLDIRHMSVTACVQNKALMNKIFQECGDAEMAFIERSGFYFGFLFGLFQMSVYCFSQEAWILPVCGFIVGWLTNFLALKVIFRPLEPKKVCGLTVHGLFLQRQQEVAVTFARVNCVEILHTKAMWDAIMTGPLHRNFFAMLRTHSIAFTDNLLGGMRTFAIAGMGAQKFNDMKEAVAQKIMDGLPGIIDQSYAYTTDVLDMENTIRTKLSELSYSEFEAVLHPAFEEDEIQLIIVGAALGLIAGLLQQFVLLEYAG